MSFDPQKLFIGLMDFFSILLPGALLTYGTGSVPHNRMFAFVANQKCVQGLESRLKNMPRKIE